MIILKFGGSSVGSVPRIESVIRIISEKFKGKKRGAVVLSAFQGITDSLIRAGQLAAKGDKKYINVLEEINQKHLQIGKLLTTKSNKDALIKRIKSLFKDLSEILHGIYLLREMTAKTQDYLMSFGERLSAQTISSALKELDIENDYLDAREIIKTDKSFGNGRINYRNTYKNIRNYFKTNKNPQITTGFIASTDQNETITLGRGGSDLTASLLGAALDAKSIEIWTDVDGVLTVDPRKVKNHFPIDQLTYEEAMELSHFGAKVIYPPTIQPALSRDIPILIKNTLNPEFFGTSISKKHVKSNNPVKGISSIDDITLIRVQGSGMIGAVGIAERIFSSLAKRQINIILITQASSEHSVCFAISPHTSPLAVESLKEEFKYEIKDGIISEIRPEHDFSIVAVVGENMRHTPGIAGKVFQTLGNNSINIAAIAQGSSERIISAVIENKDEAKALNALHDAFFLSPTKSINLYVVGTGLIGKSLLNQINQQSQVLSERYRVSVNLIGIANSKKMYMNEKGIPLDKWESIFSNSRHKMNIDKYIDTIRKNNLPNSIFIDCTADDLVSQKYREIFQSNISIVTANKKANSANYKYYTKLREDLSTHNVKFLYETNVGSAMPIINTIQDIIATGDKITRIEGVLSGTLSYIFNIFDENRSYSDSVLLARENGFTEPDPREDLNGKDVARKLLILIRESGFALEFRDIKVENLIPKEARKLNTINEFFSVLKQNDQAMEIMRKEAQNKGKVLRYIATFAKGKANTALREVGSEHPFFILEGNENIISIYTNYYKKYPLTIRGPGAGVELTAAGVLADILRASRI